MLFAIRIFDRPGSGPLRDIHRKAHLDYLRRFDEKTLFAGPFTTDDGAAELGSFRLLDLPDRAAAERHVREEPFITGGVQEGWTIRRWSPSVPYTWRDCPRREGNVPYLIEALDKAGAGDLREALRAEHEAYQATCPELFMTRGPLLDEEGERQIGSLMLIDVPDPAAARAFWEKEPFARGGLFGEVSFHRWRFGRVFDRFKNPS